jgi:hypothetical protein
MIKLKFSKIKSKMRKISKLLFNHNKENIIGKAEILEDEDAIRRI